jgi:hypothetical protein
VTACDDLDGRSSSVAEDRGGAFAGVLNAVIVLVGVRRARIGGARVEHDSTGNVARDDNRRAALQQVVGIKL